MLLRIGHAPSLVAAPRRPRHDVVRNSTRPPELRRTRAVPTPVGWPPGRRGPRPEPRVLVTAASRHGSTHEIAEALARRLQESTAAAGRELTAAALHAENRSDPTAYDAVVLGSAVYGGSWLEPARDLAHRHAAVLRTRPLWLFSSGPIGEPPYPRDEPYDTTTLTALLAPRGHRVFPGRLDATLLSFAERAMVTAMRAPVGDFRDWEAVRSWAAGSRRRSPGPRRRPAMGLGDAAAGHGSSRGR